MVRNKADDVVDNILKGSKMSMPKLEKEFQNRNYAWVSLYTEIKIIGKDTDYTTKMRVASIRVDIIEPEIPS